MALRAESRPDGGLYAAAAALSFAFVLRLVRKTKGRALEEM